MRFFHFFEKKVFAKKVQFTVMNFFLKNFFFRNFSCRKKNLARATLRKIFFYTFFEKKISQKTTFLQKKCIFYTFLIFLFL